MNFKKFLLYLYEAKDFEGKELWIATPDYPADCPYSGENWVKVLSIIYDTAHEDIKSLIKSGGVTQLSRSLDVSYPTVRGWASERRIPPNIHLIGFAMIGCIPILPQQHQERKLDLCGAED